MTRTKPIDGVAGDRTDGRGRLEGDRRDHRGRRADGRQRPARGLRGLGRARTGEITGFSDGSRVYLQGGRDAMSLQLQPSRAHRHPRGRARADPRQGGPSSWPETSRCRSVGGIELLTIRLRLLIATCRQGPRDGDQLVGDRPASQPGGRGSPGGEPGPSRPSRRAGEPASRALRERCRERGRRGRRAGTRCRDIEAALEGLPRQASRRDAFGDARQARETGEAGEMRRSATFDSGRGPGAGRKPASGSVSAARPSTGNPRNVETGEPSRRLRATSPDPKHQSAGSSGAVRAGRVRHLYGRRAVDRERRGSRPFDRRHHPADRRWRADARNHRGRRRVPRGRQAAGRR